MKKRIYLSAPHLSGEELEYIKSAFQSNWITSIGQNIDDFEREIAKRVSSPYSVALNSGTSALHLACKVAGIGKGDVVLTSSLTFIASTNAITYCGATPVLIDCDKDSWCISVSALEKALKKYKPKAILTVNLYGQSCDYDEIISLCKKYNAILIEDGAESLGSTYKGKPCGSLGDISVISFNGNKIITTSGGGMLLSNNREYVDRARFLSTQARESRDFYEHNEIGYNYRLSNILAGIGLGQLKVLDERVAKKKYIFNYYKENLKEIEEIKFMPIADYGESNYWLSVITLSGDKVTNFELMRHLESENIESRIAWKPMHLQPVYSSLDYVTTENDLSKKIFESGLCLPSDTNLTEEELFEICKQIKSAFKG